MNELWGFEWATSEGEWLRFPAASAAAARLRRL